MSKTEIRKHLHKKTILVTGGTGSIGSELVKRILEFDPRRIIVFSRNESNQHKLRFKHSSDSRLKLVIGDIRDFESIKEQSRNVDVIFHCAALKHVPLSEENPEEFIKTNILGSSNIKKAALENNIPVVVSISTDKTVNPTNVMGLTKAIQEKLFSTNHLVNPQSKTRFVNVRFGNVVGTVGSIFPILHSQIANDKPLTLTHPEMTRFFYDKRRCHYLDSDRHGESYEW
jgi:FlaA1/EpsC-like NDP-sugar epimerase